MMKIAKIEPAIKNAEILLIQLETNLDAVEKVIDIAHNNGVKVVLNPALFSKLAMTC
jgi:ribokinase